MEEKNTFEERLSFIRHELRSQLTVIKEGISLILEGVLGECDEKHSSVLQPVLESAEKINELIGELISEENLREFLPDVQPPRALPEDKLEHMKRRLLTNISHEIRTPLTIIKEGLSLLEEGVPGPVNEGQKKIISGIQGNSDRLIDTVESMLAKRWTEVADIPEE